LSSAFYDEIGSKKIKLEWRFS